MLPTAASPLVALTKRQAAATFGAMLPLAKERAWSWLQRIGEGSGRCSLGHVLGSYTASASAEGCEVVNVLREGEPGCTTA